MSDLYKIGTVVFHNWTIVRKIGAGSFGTVFEIQREDFGQVYRAALKVITVPQNREEYESVLEEGMSPDQAGTYFYSMVEDIVREFAIMAKLKGTGNVVSYEDHMVVPHSGEPGWDILIRMELLHPLLPWAYDHPMSRRDIMQLGIDLCRALELCQKYNIIHRDIKPENIFVSDNGDYKLGDFGIARTIEKTMSGLSKKGTYNYMAPEVYRGSEYGFSVDIYSLGVVLYRLLNRNRIPFLPPPPKAITYRDRESALARRMGGEAVPRPFYGEGRLGEIVQKACAFDPKERYSSPAQLREELEAILYDESDAALIYPDGDELELVKNQYASRTPSQEPVEDGSETDKTSSLFGAPVGDGTQGFFGGSDREGTQSLLGASQGEGTESIFQSPPSVKKEAPAPAPAKKPKNRLALLGAAAAVLLIAGGAAGLMHHQSVQRQEQYVQLMESASERCDSDPEQALLDFKSAGELLPDEVEPRIGYAYALYCSRDYEGCVTYIEDELGLGKSWDISVQNRLSAILGAAYFEMEDYANAAAFYRLSTAGDDVTVDAMRDYAVSLGRLGDVDAAEEVLQRMVDEGAQGLVTDYVRAEVDYAQKEYTSAEQGFTQVLESTGDGQLQRRCLRSLGELYRDCAALARVGQSPIANPASRSAELLANGIVEYGLRYDSALWEMLALAYFDAYHMDPSVPADYLTRAADCFNQVIEMGVEQSYLYANLYSIYYEQGDFQAAEEALQRYEAAFPQDYTPHALRATMLIARENQKSQKNFSPALAEYEKAQEMVTGEDDTTYLQQLEGLIQQLKDGGWI